MSEENTKKDVVRFFESDNTVGPTLTWIGGEDDNHVWWIDGFRLSGEEKTNENSEALETLYRKQEIDRIYSMQELKAKYRPSLWRFIVLVLTFRIFDAAFEIGWQSSEEWSAWRDGHTYNVCSSDGGVNTKTYQPMTPWSGISRDRCL